MKIDDLIIKLYEFKVKNGNLDVVLTTECEDLDVDFEEYEIIDEFCVGVNKTDKTRCLIMQLK